MALTGCGKTAEDVPTTETNETTETAEPEYCGTWNIDHIVVDGTEYQQSELETMDDYRGRTVLVIKDGGNAYVAEGGVDGVIVEWSETDVGINLAGDDMIFANGLLRLKVYDDEVWYFKRISDSQLIEKSEDTGTQETETEDLKNTEQTEKETVFLIDAEPVDGEIYVAGNFEYVQYTDGSIEIKKYTGSETSVDISSEIGGYLVSRIGAGAFEDCSSIEDIYLWADVISIGEAAFRNCSNLESFDIPSTITTIEASTFENCTKLEDIFIWGDVIDIGDSAFKNCESLQEINIPSKCTSIGESAFEGCTALEIVDYWGERIECGDNAFANCPNLKDMSTEIVYTKNENDVSSADEVVEEEAKAEAKGGSDDGAEEDLVDGMRPEFKEAMDSYEEFYEEYCEVLKKYMEDPTDMAVLTEYSDLMQQSIEVAEKFEEWDNGDLNTEELKYYVEVNGRVTQMLVEASGQ